MSLLTSTQSKISRRAGTSRFWAFDRNSIFILLFSAAASILTWYSLRFGVDFTDEAFYIAIPYRFALGDQPFVDEINIGQTFGFLTTPLLKVYLWLHGDLEGIVLFTRTVYFVFVCGVAAVVGVSLTNLVGWRLALLISLSCVTFVGAIPNLSYNSLGYGFFTAGVFAGWGLASKGARPLYFLLPGLCLGLAVVAYPTLAIPVAFYIALVLPWLARPPERRTLKGRSLFACLACFAGVSITALAVAPVAARAGAEHITTCLQYLNEANRDHPVSMPQRASARVGAAQRVKAYSGGLPKLLKVARTLLSSWPHKKAFLFLLVLFLVAWFKKPSWCGYLLMAMPLTFVSVRTGGPFVAATFINYYSLLAPLAASLAWHRKDVRQLLFGLWLPAFLAGLTTAWSSGVGAPSAYVGWFAGALATCALMILALEELDRSYNATHHFRLSRWQWLSPLLVVLVLLHCRFLPGSIYRDNDIPQLTSQVDSGPYQGLYTTPAKRCHLQLITQDIRQIVTAKQTILFYDLFPAGYLLSAARPATPTIWVQPLVRSSTTDRSLLVKYYHSRPKPDVVVQILQMPETLSSTASLSYPAHDAFNNFIRGQKYKQVLERKAYRILRKF